MAAHQLSASLVLLCQKKKKKLDQAISRRRADLSGAQGVVGRPEPASLVVAADASGSVKDGVGAVRVDMDLDPRLDEMGSHRAFGDLQFQRVVGNAIVVADLPLLLDAQDLVEVDAGNGRERRAFAGRVNREARVVGRRINLADEGAGRLDRGDSGEPEFLRQPVLQGMERPLGAAPRKGRPKGRPSLNGLCGE